MIRPYRLLFAATVLAGLALVSLGRAPRRETARETAAPRPSVISISLAVRDGTVNPTSISVPRDRRVLLQVENRGRAPVRFALAGYEDRLSAGAIAPGAVWSGEFLADRPGEDFAWLLDGQPAGRLAVTGSHLVEGHR